MKIRVNKLVEVLVLTKARKKQIIKQRNKKKENDYLKKSKNKTAKIMEYFY